MQIHFASGNALIAQTCVIHRTLMYLAHVGNVQLLKFLSNRDRFSFGHLANVRVQALS